MSFDAILTAAAGDVLTHLGDTFVVAGEEYTGIITDEEYIDETGVKRVVTLSVSVEVSKSLRRGDIVQSSGATYKIAKIPPLNGPMIEIELKNA